MCPYARAFIDAAVSETEAAAVVVTTTCDQMRRAADMIARNLNLPAFLMNVPHTWQPPAAHKLYISELERLGRFLAALGGKTPEPDHLWETMLKFDAARSAIRDARSSLSAREYSELIARFHRTGQADSPARETVSVPSGIPVALIGGPLLANHFDIFDLIEEAGGYVALDATETGERTMPAPLDRRLVQDDPLMALADAYFGSIPDAFRRPNSELYRWLRRKLGERGVRGIIFRRYLWCDTWHAEARRMKEWAGLPFLHLDVSDDGSDALRTFARLRSFFEVLK
jgi:benzoyl-CoA reductase/2-hydroxyglutaryl-CoA dehydratase subunit BcrC/BadD/HgdB